VGRVDILEATQDLVDKVLEVRIGELLMRADDLVHVGLHQLLHQVDLVKVIAA